MLVPPIALTPPKIIDLGVPPAAEQVEAAAINNRGEVLVRAQKMKTMRWSSSNGEKGENRVPVWYGYLWRAGQFLDFGEPKPAKMDEPPSVEPRALNDFSVVVGSEGAGTPVFMSGLTDVNPFIWRGKGKEDLGSGWASIPLAINNRGDVVGWADHRGFARLRGKIYGIGTFSHVSAGNRSTAVDINDHGVILGNSTYGGGKTIAYRLPERPFTADGKKRPLQLRPVPLPKGFSNATACAINNSGTIFAVGRDSRGHRTFPYLVKRGRVVPLPPNNALRNLGDLSGTMNDREEILVTGMMGVSSSAGSLLLFRSGGWQSLPTFPGWTLQTATGINDKGQICGTGLHNGKTRAYVLTLPDAKGPILA